jgi:biotin synthase-related radical SAM superfamily protein
MKNPLKQFASSKITTRIKEALPLGAGDKVLMGVLGRIISNPGRTASVFGAGEIFLIKSALYLTGIRLEPSAYEGVGDQYKEQVGIYHFDPNFGKGGGRALPAELALPQGFHVPIIVNDESAFSLLREKGVLYLSVNGLRLMPVEYEKRPQFYGKKTSDGIDMIKLAQHRLGDELMVTYNTYCHTLQGGNQCRFCALSPHEAMYRGKNSYFIQTPAQIAEIAEAAYGEGIARRLELTGGILPHREEIDFALETGRAVKERLGTKTVPGGHAVIAPPDKLSQIDQLKEAGWEYVFFNLEVWDPRLFAGICPGKEALIGREKWLEALDHAVTVFGKGNVNCILIAGLEPLQSYLEGLSYLTGRGIRVDPLPWTPMAGSLLEGHNTPSAQWHINVVIKTLDFWEDHPWAAEAASKNGWMHFNDLAAMRLSLKKLKEQDPSYPLEEDLRYRLAVLGQLTL